MILFTSDLDRTLIYSNTMMQTYPIAGDVVPVEHNEELIRSYMSHDSMELLKQFSKEHLFVPVTTRAVHEYERIHAIARDINPKYAITTNGGNVLIDGKPDLEWNKIVKSRLSEQSQPKEEMLRTFAKIRHESWVLGEYYVDDLFFMFRVDRELVPRGELAEFQAELAPMGWSIFLHGRKLYVLPTCLDKAYAVQYLQTFVEYDLHVAAGDSMMDYAMLLEADYGYSQTHGELYEKQPNDEKVIFLNGLGAMSTEELLRNILELNVVR
ncbi:HAD family hydrolase [Ureibacillus aquaedulcis]|uniref:HAD family hydrolase n=1 Tax=Ureibacillus aquaedulcis TaxID=3058421 RepID=A0ABT8GTL3_9BACL|nr:HAD family hydrolase [Ureibacillus sp. BA0131]MDN4494758.1 HAD family hydrolase [Ureibacillus sp. BA0131]